MSKTFRLICFVLCFSQGLYAQKETNIWYFGENAGLDFNSGSPVPIFDGQLNTYEGVATICNANGQLLFYTDGVTVYNKNHQVMENGDGLLGNYSSTQSAVIVPKPSSSQIYYIFTVGHEGSPNGLRYSEVDISLDNGLGAVTTNKNVPLLPQCSEQLTAVAHANGESIWVVSHGYANAKFHSFLVTQAGVTEMPVTSIAGLTLTASLGAIGSMKASPNGAKLGLCHITQGVQLMDFNNETGTVSGGMVLSVQEGSWGVEFSPAGNAMYVTNGDVVQFDLAAADIPASALVVLDKGYNAAQLGPNGKIYIASASFHHLSVIHNPNVIGEGCNAEEDALFLGGPKSFQGLPNFVQSFFAGEITASHLCQGDATALALMSTALPESILWDFGDGSTSTEMEPTHTYALPGTYTVSASFSIGGNLRVIEKIITILPLPIAHTPDDLFACDDPSGDGKEPFNLSQQDGIILGGQNPDDYSVSYHLNLSDAESNVNGLPGNYTNIVNPQTIHVRVTNNESGCFAVTSFTIAVLEHPIIEMPDDYLICEGSSTILTAPAGFDSYLWSTGATTSSVTVDEPGTYTVTVTQNTGGTSCGASKTVTVSLSLPPVIEDVVIRDWTDRQNSITIVPSGYEYSIDGIHYQDSPEFLDLEPGLYTIHIRDRNHCTPIERTVLLLMYPKFFTPNGDTYNEIWQIKYARYEPGLRVYVFDRYGKLISAFNGNDPGWDGTFNGSSLPSTDYWFVVERSDGSVYKGHFSMIR